MVIGRWSPPILRVYAMVSLKIDSLKAEMSIDVGLCAAESVLLMLHSIGQLLNELAWACGGVGNGASQGRMKPPFPLSFLYISFLKCWNNSNFFQVGTNTCF